jgi:hypothetical protein
MDDSLQSVRGMAADPLSPGLPALALAPLLPASNPKLLLAANSLDAYSSAVLVLPPTAPPQPTFGATQPVTLRLRTRGDGGIQQLDGHVYAADRMDTWDSNCIYCKKLCTRFCLKKERWKANQFFKTAWCPECDDLRPNQLYPGMPP